MKVTADSTSVTIEATATETLTIIGCLGLAASMSMDKKEYDQAILLFNRASQILLTVATAPMFLEHAEIVSEMAQQIATAGTTALFCSSL